MARRELLSRCRSRSSDVGVFTARTGYSERRPWVWPDRVPLELRAWGMQLAVPAAGPAEDTSRGEGVRGRAVEEPPVPWDGSLGPARGLRRFEDTTWLGTLTVWTKCRKAAGLPKLYEAGNDR